ncbi:MAG: polymerase subunit chi [Pseudomonadota bacterium]|jgi:DNA polymerase-3 subunit chi
MTQVDFHFNAPDKWLYSSRLLRKANAQGKRVGVWCDADSGHRLNQSLWQLAATDFVSHCLISDSPERVSRSSIVMAEDWTALRQLPKLDVYLNLNHSVPSDLNQLARLIEVVGPDEDDKGNARQRWKHYTQLGFVINRYDLAASPAA